jgi:hypothetical protein
LQLDASNDYIKLYYNFWLVTTYAYVYAGNNT